jgi:hypothetical protein
MNTDAAQQNDEKNADDPAGQLAQANQEIARMSRDLEDLQITQKLTHKLAAAGAIDLEAAVLVAKARIGGTTQPVESLPVESLRVERRVERADIDACIAQLKKEKAYLFGGSTETTAARKTASVKDRTTTGQTALEQAAQKAAKTGSRADLHHYLKLRRNLL